MVGCRQAPLPETDRGAGYNQRMSRWKRLVRVFGTPALGFLLFAVTVGGTLLWYRSQPRSWDGAEGGWPARALNPRLTQDSLDLQVGDWIVWREATRVEPGRAGLPGQVREESAPPLVVAPGMKGKVVGLDDGSPSEDARRPRPAFLRPTVALVELEDGRLVKIRPGMPFEKVPR